MKKLFFTLTMFVLLPFLLTAQRRERIVDITVNPKALADRNANLCVQLTLKSRVGLCTSFDFSATTGETQRFSTQSTEWGNHSEIRIYPFKDRAPLLEKANTSKKYKGKRNPCYNFNKTAPINYLNGLFIAPGFLYQKQQLSYIALPEFSTPIPRFDYLIVSQGGSLAVGYQLRINHITLGIGWGISAAKPRWSGPEDIFDDRLFTTTYPWKLNVQQGLRFEAGINF